MKNSAGSETCGSDRGAKWILIQRWGEEDATFDAFLVDDSDAADSAGASVVEHCVENCFLHELNASFLLHFLLEVLADEAVDERAAGAADCAALTDHHATFKHKIH